MLCSSTWRTASVCRCSSSTGTVGALPLLSCTLWAAACTLLEACCSGMQCVCPRGEVSVLAESRVQSGFSVTPVALQGKMFRCNLNHISDQNHEPPASPCNARENHHCLSSPCTPTCSRLPSSLEVVKSAPRLRCRLETSSPFPWLLSISLPPGSFE